MDLRNKKSVDYRQLAGANETDHSDDERSLPENAENEGGNPANAPSVDDPTQENETQTEESAEDVSESEIALLEQQVFAEEQKRKKLQNRQKYDNLRDRLKDLRNENEVIVRSRNTTQKS